MCGACGVCYAVYVDCNVIAVIGSELEERLDHSSALHTEQRRVEGGAMHGVHTILTL
jgi:hypothetical protein